MVPGGGIRLLQNKLNQGPQPGGTTNSVKCRIKSRRQPYLSLNINKFPNWNEGLSKNKINRSPRLPPNFPVFIPLCAPHPSSYRAIPFLQWSYCDPCKKWSSNLLGGANCIQQVHDGFGFCSQLTFAWDEENSFEVVQLFDFLTHAIFFKYVRLYFCRCPTLGLGAGSSQSGGFDWITAVLPSKSMITDIFGRRPLSTTYSSNICI